MSADWIDITMPIAAGMEHWPGDPDTVVSRFAELATGGEYNATQFTMSAHAGTHVDAPLHFLDDGRSIDEMPVTQLVGPARVVSFHDASAAAIHRGERILLRGTPHTGIPMTLACRLAESAVPCVGVDVLSAGDAEVHRTLLRAGVWIIENLRLERVDPGEYELVCLPLKITGSDGAPARAVLRRLG